MPNNGLRTKGGMVGLAKIQNARLRTVAFILLKRLVHLFLSNVWKSKKNEF
jgi:hypothetical protein